MPDAPDRKLPIELLLSESLIREAREFLGDISAPIEHALRRYVEVEKFRGNKDFQKRLDATIDLATRYYDQHGIWGEEFSTL